MPYTSTECTAGFLVFVMPFYQHTLLFCHSEPGRWLTLNFCLTCPDNGDSHTFRWLPDSELSRSRPFFWNGPNIIQYTGPNYLHIYEVISTMETVVIICTQAAGSKLDWPIQFGLRGVRSFVPSELHAWLAGASMDVIDPDCCHKLKIVQPGTKT